MQLTPREYFSVVRQLSDPADSGTYYVRAKVRNARTDELLATLNLQHTGNQRYRLEYQTPADPTGEGFFIDIETMVYTDSGYTTVSDAYGRENAVYLVQERKQFLGHGGGVNTEIDYQKMKSLIGSELDSRIEKKRPEKKEKLDLTPVESRIIALAKQLEELFGSLDIPNHGKEIAAMRKDIKEASDAILSAIEAKEVTPETDLSPVIDKIDEIEGTFSGKIDGFISAMQKYLTDDVAQIRGAMKKLFDKFSGIPYITAVPQGKDEKIEFDATPAAKAPEPAPVRPPRKRIGQRGFIHPMAILLAAVLCIAAGLISRDIMNVSSATDATDVQLGDSVSVLDQWKSDGTNITQRTANKPLKISGLTPGGCVQLTAANIATTTGSPCGSGGGGAYPFPLTGNATSTQTKFDGGLSIGTSSPEAYLAIAAGSKNTSNILLISTSTASATNTVFRVDSQGRTIIGPSGGTSSRADGLTVFSTNTGTNGFVTFYTNTGTIVFQARGDNRVGIGGSAGAMFSVRGGISIGSNFGGLGAPTNGAIIEGTVGIGTSSATLPGRLTVTTPNSDAGTTPFLAFFASTTNGVATPTAMTLDTYGNMDLGQTSVALPSNQSQLLTIKANGASSVSSAGTSLTLNTSSGNTNAFFGLDRTASTLFLGMTIGATARDGIRFMTTPGGTRVEYARLTVDGRFGIGTSSPNGWLTISTPLGATGATSTMFQISSSSPTATTSLMLVNNKGGVFYSATTTATSTTMTVDMSAAPWQTVRVGTAATAITLANAVVGQMPFTLEVCNPNTTAGATTFTNANLLWPYSVTPASTVTANKCDLYTFRVGNGTSTPIIYGGYNQSY